jgi:hypothetical protein
MFPSRKFIMKGISSVKSRLLDAAVQIRDVGYEPEKAFVSREMVQATLPHKNPGDVPAWSRTNGNYALTIQPGWDTWEKQSFGYPYGTIPRLLIFWLTTEALRTGNRHVELGDHLADFMRKLGLDSSRGGVRSDAYRLRDQMERLFRARISFEYRDDQQQSWLDMQIAPKGMQWWSHNLNEQPTLWENWIELGEEFYKAITAYPVPVNMDALQVLKKSPLALDLYAWLTNQAFRASSSKRARKVAWRSLHEQLGSDYTDVQNFRRKAIDAIRKIEVVYPELQVEMIEGGLSVKPCGPAIPSKHLKTAEKPALPPAQPLAPAQSVADKVSAKALETAKELVLVSGTGWDIYTLEQEFYDYAAKKGAPKYLDKAFVGFVRRKIGKKA